MIINPRQEEILEKLGWVVECKSPLEIRHEDGSFASMQAAAYAIDAILRDYAFENEPPLVGTLV